MQQQVLQQQLQIVSHYEIRGLDQFLCLVPPSFVGEGSPDKADFWIFEIEKKFKVMRCLEEEKVNLAAYMLQGRADCWWQALQHTTFANQEGPIPWEEFLEIFRAKYFPDHVQG